MLLLLGERMSLCPPCLPPKGQLFHFPGTNGPLLLLGEAMPCGPHYVCVPWCCPAPKLPQGTTVFFEPAKVAPPYRPPMPPSPPPPVPPVPPVIYGNSPQTCEDICPDGTTGPTITVTIPENTFFDPDQAVANAAALAAACAEVNALRLLSPCVPDGPFEPSLLEAASREREGEATLCGFNEYANVSPSCPPKKYLRLGGDASVRWTYFPIANPGGIDCPDPEAGFVPRGYDQTGEWNYDPVTCVKTGGGTVTPIADGGPPFPATEAYFGYPSGCPAPEGCGVICENTNDTQTASLEADPPCCGTYFPAERQRYTTFTGLYQLTNEDTEANAIARSTLPPWGAFGAFGPLPAGDATQALRTCTSNPADFDFDFQQSQISIHAEGFTPSTQYTMNVHVWRQNLTTLVSELAEIQNYSPTSDGAGEINEEIQLPNEAGYKMYVDDIVFFEI